MIIGINGYINSGKDTVGKIIQYLVTLDKIKDPEIMKSFEKQGYNLNYTVASGIEIKKFAGKLKQIASFLTGIPTEKFEDQEFKKTTLGKEWNYLKQVAENEIDEEGNCHDYYDKRPMTVREFLQRLGTEGLRMGLHENVWVNALFADYKAIPTSVTSHTGIHSWIEKNAPYPNWIITDVRFPNEAQAIKERDGVIIRVNRGFDNLQIGDNQIRIQIDPTTLHPSETSLDDWKFDYTIDNNGTIDELQKNVRKLLLEIK